MLLFVSSLAVRAGVSVLFVVRFDFEFYLLRIFIFILPSSSNI